MSFSNGFRGTVGGSIQTTYYDDMGKSIPGMLMSASDYNMTDTYFIGETAGIGAGIGVRLTDATDAFGFQIPSLAAKLPEGDEGENDFGGVIVFDQAMQSDENGENGWAYRRPCRVLRPVRTGGRIAVRVAVAVNPTTDTVNWVIDADDAGTYALGSFVPTALGGGAAGVSVLLSAARWVSAADAGGIAVIEFLGNSSAVYNSNSSL
jgi:hypothetical protein